MTRLTAQKKLPKLPASVCFWLNRSAGRKCPWKWNAYRLMVNLADGIAPSPQWKWLPGRPRRTWLSHIYKDSGITPSVLWTTVIRKGRGAAQKPSRTKATTTMTKLCMRTNFCARNYSPVETHGLRSNSRPILWRNVICNALRPQQPILSQTVAQSVIRLAVCVCVCSCVCSDHPHSAACIPHTAGGSGGNSKTAAAAAAAAW